MALNTGEKVGKPGGYGKNVLLGLHVILIAVAFYLLFWVGQRFVMIYSEGNVRLPSLSQWFLDALQFCHNQQWFLMSVAIVLLGFDLAAFHFLKKRFSTFAEVWWLGLVTLLLVTLDLCIFGGICLLSCGGVMRGA